MVCMVAIHLRATSSAACSPLLTLSLTSLPHRLASVQSDYDVPTARRPRNQ